MRQLPALAVALLLVVSGGTVTGCGPPSDPGGWAKRAVSRARTDEKLEAIGHVRKLCGREADGKERSTADQRRAAVDPLATLLADKQVKTPVRAEAALALGEIGDTRAVKPLLDAIDPAPKDRDAHDLNRKIADALGALRATEAVPALEQLARSADGYTQVAAVDALGKIGDPAAVDTLADIATSEHSEPFTAKKALLAIGQIGDDEQHRGRAAVLRMIFAERPGVTFFPEASFATYQLGKTMAEPLLAVLEGKDAELSTWARQQGIPAGALYAKSAQLLGDVGGPEVVPALVQRLGYEDAEPGLTLFVRVFAAESLGRLRAKEAVRPLADMAAREKDANVRDRYCDALARIGDTSVLPSLRTAAAAGEWDMREGPLTAVSRLGGKEDKAFLDSVRAKECPKDCAPVVKAALDGMAARLEAAVACGADPACWEKKLEDPGAAVRDRAALEVGRAGGAKQAPALATALVRPVESDADVAARYHAVLALNWIVAREPLGAAGAEVAAKIDAILATDRGRTLTAGVNEDAMRLASRLRRTR
jgi:HEAT repeat protein